MITQDLRTLAAPFERTTKIIWLAFIGGPIVYCVIAWILTQGGEKRMPGDLPPEAIYIAILLAIGSGIVLPWVIAPRFLGPARMMAESNMAPVTFGGDSARVFERLGE